MFLSYYVIITSDHVLQTTQEEEEEMERDRDREGERESESIFNYYHLYQLIVKLKY